MTKKEIRDDYFSWLFDLVCEEKNSKQISYKKLLTHLHKVEFTCLIDRDQNRAADGVSLRYRFASMQPHDDLVDYVVDSLSGPCSVLEMMIALSIRCEENIMDDATMGDRTKQWFWEMIVNLGLGSMTDSRFDCIYVNEVIRKFLDREYDRDGKGGLFRIRHCDCDLRNVEIWHQLCWYLDSIT